MLLAAQHPTEPGIESRVGGGGGHRGHGQRVGSVGCVCALGAATHLGARVLYVCECAPLPPYGAPWLTHRPEARDSAAIEIRPETKLKVVRILRHMHHERWLLQQARELCEKLLQTHPSQAFVVTTLHTLTSLASVSLLFLKEQVRECVNA